MMTPTTTREAVLAAIAECDRLGEEAFLKLHGYGKSAKYRISHEGKLYPSKAILGVAAGLAAKDFSGGAAHTARQLNKLGFRVDQVGKGTLATVLAIVAGVAMSWPFEAPAAPEGLPLDPSAVFASGSNRPGEILGFAELGHDVGVAAPEVSPASERALGKLAGTDVQVFVDSGAFSEVEFGADGVKVVKPITDAEWVKRLDLYERLAGQLGDQLWVVAPDMVGNQEVTLERLARHAPQMRRIASRGARILVPVQKGALSQADFWARAQAVLGIEGAIPALPCKKAATTAREVIAFCHEAQPTKLHLLGLGLRNANAFDYLYAVASMAPGCQVTVDSNVLAAHIGTSGGPEGGPRRVTLARRWGEALAACGRMARTAVTEFSTLLAFGGKKLAGQRDEGALACLGELAPRPARQGSLFSGSEAKAA